MEKKRDGWNFLNYILYYPTLYFSIYISVLFGRRQHFKMMVPWPLLLSLFDISFFYTIYMGHSIFCHRDPLLSYYTIKTNNFWKKKQTNLENFLNGPTPFSKKQLFEYFDSSYFLRKREKIVFFKKLLRCQLQQKKIMAVYSFPRVHHPAAKKKLFLRKKKFRKKNWKIVHIDVDIVLFYFVKRRRVAWYSLFYFLWLSRKITEQHTRIVDITYYVILASSDPILPPCFIFSPLCTLIYCVIFWNKKTQKIENLYIFVLSSWFIINIYFFKQSKQ